MNIELPNEVIYVGNNSHNYVRMRNHVLEIHGPLPFRSLIFTITYQLRGKKKCCYCGRQFQKGNMTIDHIYPQEFGGPTITNNLLPVCSSCNSNKGSMTLEEYKQVKEVKTQEEKRALKKEILEKHKKIREEKKYVIPKKWISEIEVSQIIVRKDFQNWKTEKVRRDYRGKKYKKVEEFYQRYGYFKNLVILDKNYYILEGVMNYLYACDQEIEKIPAIVLDNVEQIL